MLRISSSPCLLAFSLWAHALTCIAANPNASSIPSTFPQLRRQLRPTRIADGPCPSVCAGTEYFRMVGGSISHVLSDMAQHFESNCSSLACAGPPPPAFDAYSTMFSRRLLQSVPHFLGNKVYYEEYTPSGAHKQEQDQVPGRHSPIWFHTENSGIGNKAWSWGTASIFNMLFQKPFIIHSYHLDMVGWCPHHHLDQTPDLAWSPSVNHTLKNEIHSSLKPQDFIDALGKEIHILNRPSQYPLRLMEALVPWLHAKGSEFIKNQAPELKRAALHPRHLIDFGEMLTGNIFWRPAPSLVSLLQRDALVVFGNATCEKCLMIGVHARFGTGKESKTLPQAVHMKPYVQHVNSLIGVFASYYHKLGEPVPKVIVYLAADREDAAHLICSLLEQHRCIYLPHSKLAAHLFSEGHFFKTKEAVIEEEVHAHHSTEESLLQYGYEAIRDLFFLSMTDAIVGTGSTFNEFAFNWGGIPQLFVKRERRYAPQV